MRNRGAARGVRKRDRALYRYAPDRDKPKWSWASPGSVVATVLWVALPELEREVIMLRFFQDLDQYEVAARVGYSQMHISRLQRRALARMRVQLVEP